MTAPKGALRPTIEQKTMIHTCNLDEISLSHSWLTVGVFDGVHRGHQEIIRRLTSGAHAAGAQAAVLTFWPHPATVLGDGQVKCLSTAEERVDLLSALGVDVVITYPFRFRDGGDFRRRVRGAPATAAALRSPAHRL